MKKLFCYTQRIMSTMFIAIMLMGTCLASTLTVHPVILDFSPKQLQRANLEIQNKSNERLFVAAEPARIDSPGTRSEMRISVPDPEELGLLASPPRLIIEPGERRFIRVAALDPAGESDRIFRLAVKPVVGELFSEQTGLKVLVGYDVLVIQRPAEPRSSILWQDNGTEITLTNEGNSNLQIVRGEACYPDGPKDKCVELRPHRLYAGNTITLTKPNGTVVSYDVLFMGKVKRQIFK